MVEKGRVLKGTPLARLVDALHEGGSAVTALAGDVADVCRLCDDSDPVVVALQEETKGYPGKQVTIDGDDARHLLELLVVVDEAEEEEAPPSDAPPKAARASRKHTGKKAAEVGDQKSQ